MTSRSPSDDQSILSIGIDVGGKTKGFHAVALRGTTVCGTVSTCRAADMADWCREQSASAVGVDAPCQWSVNGRARPCERELARLGMSAFSTPCQAIGKVHPFYRWMVNGAALFACLSSSYRLYNVRSPLTSPFCFETFPHAIACVLAGRTLSAKKKRVDRPRLLKEAGITASLKNIDEVDAALCALAAQYVLDGRFTAYGDAVEGFLLVPAPKRRSQIQNFRSQTSPTISNRKSQISQDLL